MSLCVANLRGQTACAQPSRSAAVVERSWREREEPNSIGSTACPHTLSQQQYNPDCFHPQRSPSARSRGRYRV
jgi:hypothetical protein